MSYQIVLLFQNSHRVTLTASDLGLSTLSALSIDSLIHYVFVHWTQETQGEKPTTEKQLRLIHLGRPLDTSNVKTVGELNLEFSDIIHVILRPLESLEQTKKTKKSLNLNRRSQSKPDPDGNEIERNIDKVNNAGSNGCCVIA